MSVEKDIQDIKKKLDDMHKHSHITEGIQLAAIALIFFFGISTIHDLRKIFK